MSSGCALGGITAVDKLAYFFMFNKVAPVRSLQAFFYLLKEPLIEVDEPLYRLLHECFSLATLLVSKTRKFRFQLRGEMYFDHSPKRKERNPGCQALRAAARWLSCSICRAIHSGCIRELHWQLSLHCRDNCPRISELVRHGRPVRTRAPMR